MSPADIGNLVGRGLVGFYFLWATGFNLRSREEHLGHFRSLGLPWPALWFPIGMALQGCGALLLLYDPTAVIGGSLLILFTLSADLLYHRFWLIEDPQERITQKLYLYEHMALCGGLLGLLSFHLPR